MLLAFWFNKKNRVTKNSHIATLPNHGIEIEIFNGKTHNIRTNFYGPFGEFIITDKITITRKFNGLTFFWFI